MNARNIFIVAMLVLVAALFFYLFGAIGTKPKEESASARQPAISAEEADSRSSVGDIQPMEEADSKLQELKAQQGAVSSDGLSLLYLVKCSACHGRDGRGPVGPPIAGKSVEENMAILMKYKMKQVPNSAMLGLLEQTSDQELEMLARETAAF
jgi:cytochrome c553